MNLYTGGFWEIDDTNSADVKIVSNDKIIATIERGEGITHKEHKANARLIKYAPVLKQYTVNSTYRFEHLLNQAACYFKQDDLKKMRKYIAEVRRCLILIEGE